MTDHELIAACRARLAAVGENPATDPLFDYAAWAAQTLPALLDALEEAQAVQERREALSAIRADSLRAEIGRLDVAYADLRRAHDAARDIARGNSHALDVALEAAQRPPLGYIVLAKAPSRTEPDVADYANPSIPVYTDVEQAREVQRMADAAAMGRAAAVYREGMSHVIAELREVQP